MTNLTEQWKKGELPYGRYYVELAYNGNNIIMAEYWWDKALMLDDHEYSREEVKRILAPVPSYEKYQQLLSDQLAKNEGVEINAELEAENTKLKELLKEAKEVIEWYEADCGYKDAPTENVLAKINQALGEE